MGTTWCHQCRAEYWVDVDACPVCGEPLRSDPPGENAAEPTRLEVHTDVTGLDFDQRATLGLLLRDQVPAHRWAGSTLIHGADDTATVNELVAFVTGRAGAAELPIGDHADVVVDQVRHARLAARALRVVAALVTVCGLASAGWQMHIVSRDEAFLDYGDVVIAQLLGAIVQPLAYGGLLFAASVALDLWTVQLRRLSER